MQEEAEILSHLFIILRTCVSLYARKILHTRNVWKTILECRVVFIWSVLMCWVSREIMLQDLFNNTASWMTGGYLCLCWEKGGSGQVGVGTFIESSAVSYFVDVFFHYTYNNVLVSIIDWNVKLQECKVFIRWPEVEPCWLWNGRIMSR